MSIMLCECFDLSQHLTILKFFREYPFLINAEINPKVISVPSLKLLRRTFAFLYQFFKQYKYKERKFSFRSMTYFGRQGTALQQASTFKKIQRSLEKPKNFVFIIIITIIFHTIILQWLYFISPFRCFAICYFAIKLNSTNQKFPWYAKKRIKNKFFGKFPYILYILITKTLFNFTLPKSLHTKLFSSN